MLSILNKNKLNIKKHLNLEKIFLIKYFILSEKEFLITKNLRQNLKKNINTINDLEFSIDFFNYFAI